MNAFTMPTEGGHALRLPIVSFSTIAPFTADSAESARDTVTIAERTAVYRAGDLAKDTYELISGNVILWKMLCDGRRQILQVVGPNDVFGFCSHARHDTTAEAVIRSKMRVIPISQSTGSSSDQGEFLVQALKRIEALQVHALMLGRMSALERLANFLLSHISGKAGPADEMAAEPEIRIFVTREEIGDYLGLTIETVSRCFGKLKSAGIIKLDQADRVCVKNLADLQTIASQQGRTKRSK